MDIIGTATHALSAALAHVDHAALTPIIAGAAGIALVLWGLARRRKASRT